jgi:hypothetical protein
VLLLFSPPLRVAQGRIEEGAFDPAFDLLLGFFSSFPRRREPSDFALDAEAVTSHSAVENRATRESLFFERQRKVTKRKPP